VSPAPRLSARVLGVVAAGGILGVAARELLLLPFAAGEAAPDALALPAATMAVNVAGSLALGLVVGLLADRRPLTRAFVGTGVLGGFTTYSAFAVQSAVLLAAAPWAGGALAIVSVLLGLAAAALGLRLTRLPRRGGTA
jgi:fluoride exporter